MTPRLILASGSPRRRELLQQVGLPFVVARPDIDETPLADEPPDLYVARLSVEKGRAVLAPARSDVFQGAHNALDQRENALIITADTTVADGSAILGKPLDAAEAFAMLASLRGREHIVHTGLTLTDTASRNIETTVTTSRVEMRPYTDDDIHAYIARSEPYDKAGGYAIQDQILRPVQHFIGCYTNIMGLPLCTLCKLLNKHQLKIAYTPSCSPTSGGCEFGTH